VTAAAVFSSKYIWIREEAFEHHVAVIEPISSAQACWIEIVITAKNYPKEKKRRWCRARAFEEYIHNNDDVSGVAASVKTRECMQMHVDVALAHATAYRGPLVDSGHNSKFSIFKIFEL
jgi:hypothetical protein